MNLKAQTEQFRANLFHVFPNLALLLGRTQEVGGMECGNDPHAVDIVELSAKLRDGRPALQHGLSRKFSKTADDLRTDRGDLALEKRIADENFTRRGVAFAGRPALQDVADVGLVA